MAVNIDAMAAQSAQQGQQLYNQFKNQAATSTGQYNAYNQAANDANNNVKNYTTAMQGNYDASKGTGNAQSAYDYNLGQQEGNVGYNQGAMTNASNAVNQDLGQIAGARDFMNQAASKWGMNAGALSAFNANSLGSLNDTLAAHQGAVSQLMDKYKTAQTGANSVVGFQQKGQEDTLTGLQGVYANAADQRDKAGEMMNFYNNMAAQQGGLNSKQQSDYATAKAAFASAQAAIAQAGYLISQTTGQNLTNQRDQAYMNSKAYHNKLLYGNESGPQNQGGGGNNNAGGGGLFSNSLHDWQHMALGADTVGKVGEGAKWLGNKIGGIF